MSEISSAPVSGSSTLNVALDGLARSEKQLNTAASQIAQFPQDSVDLSQPIVAMIDAKNSFDANTKSIKVADEMQKTLLDAIG